MIWLSVTATLIRELVRALIVPARLLLYLPRRRHWRRRAREALAAASQRDGATEPDQLAAFFDRRKPHRGDRPHLFVSAGEASGEQHASRLVGKVAGEARVTAFGGGQLAEAGADVRFALSEHAVMGVVGVLKQLPLILRAYAGFLRLLRDDPPDLVVLVDYPGLHLVMAKACRRRGVPVLHYVAPQYWAWGPWRMRRYRRAVDATLTILPFETEFFARQGVPSAYIGHPLLDELRDAPPDADENGESAPPDPNGPSRPSSWSRTAARPGDRARCNGPRTARSDAGRSEPVAAITFLGNDNCSQPVQECF